MKKKFKIKRVNYTFAVDGEKVATGFVLGGVCSDVDPFVGAEFINEPNFESQNELNQWYESQVGKYLFCDDLVVKAIATIGKTYIV